MNTILIVAAFIAGLMLPAPYSTFVREQVKAGWRTIKSLASRASEE